MVEVMAQDADVDILEHLARDGAMDYSNWPGLLDCIVPRLNNIVYNEFPTPSIPLPEPLPPSVSGEYPIVPNDRHRNSIEGMSSQGSQKENPSQDSLHPVIPVSPPPNVPPAELYPSIPDSQPSSISAPTGTLPPQLLSLFSSIQSTLQTSFSTAPPHTIQRLAELILRPSDHYRTLPSYLRALDRVLSVSSTANIYPLQAIASESVENGDEETNSYLTSTASTIRRDDFNGAALTRIPWLRDTSSMLSNADRPLTSDLRTESTSLIDGPNGAGSLETVTVSINGVPVTSRENSRSSFMPDTAASSAESVYPGRVTRSSTAIARRGEEADEERVHARGPDEIGMEDMGPQATDREPGEFDVEAALGRKAEESSLLMPSVVHREEGRERGDPDADGDVVVGDVDGKGEEVEEEGEE